VRNKPNLPISDCGLGTNRPLWARAGRFCGTKPICPATPRGTRAKCAKRTQFGPGGQEGTRVAGRARRGTTAPNKANCPQRGTEAVSCRSGTRGARGVVQTRCARQKPGSADPSLDIRPETWIEIRLGDFCRGRQTNPIRRAFRAQQSQSAPAGENRWGKPHPTCAPNKPNLPTVGIPPSSDCSIIPIFRSHADCAKRTQFGTDGHGRPSSRPKALAMPPVTGAMAQNKANSSPGQPSRERSVRNKPKLGQAGESGQWRLRRANSAKQSQFRKESQSGVSGVKLGEPGVESSQPSSFKPYTSNFTLRRSRQGFDLSGAKGYLRTR
jgi:hypothetical protein